MNRTYTRNQLLEAFNFAVLSAQGMIATRPLFPAAMDADERSRQQEVKDARDWYGSAIKRYVIPDDLQVVSDRYVDSALRTVWDTIMAEDAKDAQRGGGWNVKTKFVQSFLGYLETVDLEKENFRQRWTF